MNKVFTNGTVWDKIFAVMFAFLCGFGIVTAIIALFTDMHYNNDLTFLSFTALFIGAVLLYFGGFITKYRFLRGAIWVASITMAISSFIATLITTFSSKPSSGSIAKHAAADVDGGGYFVQEEKIVDLSGGHQFFKNLALAAFIVGISLVLMALFFKLYNRINHINNIDKKLNTNVDEKENLNYFVTNIMFKVTGGFWIAFMGILAMDIMFGVIEDNILLAFGILVVTGIVATYQSYFLSRFSRKKKPISAEAIEEYNRTTKEIKKTQKEETKESNNLEELSVVEVEELKRN